MNLIEEIIDIESINTEFKVGDKVIITEVDTTKKQVKANKIGKIYTVRKVKRNNNNKVCTEKDRRICRKTSKDTCIFAVDEREEGSALWSCFYVMRKVKER